MNNFFAALCMQIIGLKDFVTNEVRRMKNDERGMELLQVLLIVLIVVAVGALVWAFLVPWIAELIDNIGDPPEIDVEW